MTIRRREVLTGTAATGLLASARQAGPSPKQARAGPCGFGGSRALTAGCGAAMNEWAQKDAPALKFEIETIPWDGVYVKLMTDLAAPAAGAHQRRFALAM